jgi:hypothetical protein
MLVSGGNEFGVPVQSSSVNGFLGRHELLTLCRSHDGTCLAYRRHLRACASFCVNAASVVPAFFMRAIRTLAVFRQTAK